MQEPIRPPQALRFGLFEFDWQAGELRKQGRKLKLHGQPIQILEVLLERPGEVVSREELKRRIWPGDTFVDFDHSLNTAINKLREALSDSAENPRFVDTVPRRGYRFIAPLEAVVPPEATAVQPRARGLRYGWVVALGLVGVLAVATYVARHRFGAQAELPSGRVMLAVLPFENLSGNPEQEYFSDGLTEEMITQLCRLNPERLGVIARTSAMHYKNTNKRVDQIGRELGAHYILEGSVRREGERVRISAQLIRARDQSHLWAHNYERDLRDVLALQSEVAQAIARGIQIKLTPEQGTGSARAGPVNPEAYEAYLKARFFRYNRGAGKDIEHFQLALQIDPNYAAAYAGLAESYASLGTAETLGIPPRDIMPKAEEAALKALEIDTTLAEAHMALGQVKLFYAWDWAAAEKELTRALELNPNSLQAHHWYSHLLTALGRQQESLQASQRALELDPVNRQVQVHLVWYYLLARQYEQVFEQGRKAGELYPDARYPHDYLARAYSHKGLHDLALTQAQEAFELSGRNPYQLATLGFVYAAAGKKSEALRVLEELQAVSRQRHVTPYSFATIYAALGDHPQALAWLEKGYGERAAWMVYLRADPRLDPLRSDPRFQELLQRMRFPQ